MTAVLRFAREFFVRMWWPLGTFLGLWLSGRLHASETVNEIWICAWIAIGFAVEVPWWRRRIRRWRDSSGRSAP